MTVPVCILSYNHPQITAKAIQSCLAQLEPKYIFVLHNGSEPKHVQNLKSLFPQIQHWQISDNRGYTGGVNEILRRGFAQFPWLLLLTNDCELLTEPRTPSFPGFYGVRTWARKKGRLDSCLGKVNFSNGRLSHLKSENIASLKPYEQLYVHGAAFLLHRDVFVAVGEFDEGLHTYCEDLDYSLRVAAAGFPIDLLAELEVLHHIGKTCHKDPAYTTYYYQRNRRRVCLRHCPPEFRTRLRLNLSIEAWLSRWRLLRRGHFQRLGLLNRAIRDV